jgi:hypothetical protein
MWMWWVGRVGGGRDNGSIVSLSLSVHNCIAVGHWSGMEERGGRSWGESFTDMSASIVHG